jgi:hypothetical protein
VRETVRDTGRATQWRHSERDGERHSGRHSGDTVRETVRDTGRATQWDTYLELAGVGVGKVACTHSPADVPRSCNRNVELSAPACNLRVTIRWSSLAGSDLERGVQ